MHTPLGPFCLHHPICNGFPTIKGGFAVWNRHLVEMRDLSLLRGCRSTVMSRMAPCKPLPPHVYSDDIAAYRNVLQLTLVVWNNCLLQTARMLCCTDPIWCMKQFNAARNSTTISQGPIISIWIPLGDQAATRASEPNATGITLRLDLKQDLHANPNKARLKDLIQHEPTKPHAPVARHLTTP